MCFHRFEMVDLKGKRREPLGPVVDGGVLGITARHTKVAESA